MFNPTEFLDATTTEVNEKRPPLPIENPDSPDGLYTAIIGDITPKSGPIKNGDRAGENYVRMDVPLKIDVPVSLQQSLKLQDRITIIDGVMLDLTPSGGLDMSPGKNRGQRVYREATDLNKPGEPFSWRMLSGKVVKVKLRHEEYPQGSGNLVEKPAGVVKA